MAEVFVKTSKQEGNILVKPFTFKVEAYSMDKFGVIAILYSEDVINSEILPYTQVIGQLGLGKALDIKYKLFNLMEEYWDNKEVEKVVLSVILTLDNFKIEALETLK